ncbi:MAG: TonB terminal [Pseudomonadota bacterium]
MGLLRKQPGDEYWRAGFSLSVAAHLVLAYIIFVKVFPNFGDMPEPVVYSISIEGGKNLGGMTQVAKDNKPSQMAPMKNVAAEAKKEPDVAPEKNPKKEAPVEDAEVSVAEKKPTPAPTPSKVATAKATPSPAKKVDAKNDAKNTKKSDGEDTDKRLQAALQRYLGESSDGGGKGFGAAKVGGNAMGGGVVRPPEFFVYEKIVRQRIKEAWRWYDTNSTLITVIAFEIEPDGVIKNVRLVKTSGDSNYDESVMRAAMKASPLPAPPRSVYEQYFKSVRITFDPRE